MAKLMLILANYVRELMHILAILSVGVALTFAKYKAVVEGSRVFTEFKGALTEQFVQQEIRAEAGLASFYWSAPDSRAEVDFLVETDDGVVPVEVKAERNLQAKSLKRYAELFGPEVSIRTSMSEWSRREKLLDIPLYAIGRFRSIP